MGGGGEGEITCHVAEDVCSTDSGENFPFSLSRAALLLFFSLSRLQDPNSISANTTVI